MSDPVGAEGDSDPMRCEKCGTTDRDEPILAFRVSTPDGDRMMRLCGRHMDDALKGRL